METIEKDTLQPIVSNSLFDGETVVDAIEIVGDKINGVGSQKQAYSKNVLFVNPNITGLSAATVAGAALTGAGVKAKIKSFFSYDVHG